MFEIGFWEIIIIVLVGTILLGPKNSTDAIKKIIQQTKKINNELNNVRCEIEDGKTEDEK